MQGRIVLPYRILDLCDEKGIFCGRILADLGASVIKLEKSDGDATRSIGPFYHNGYNPEKSLFWLAYCANKHSITLNIECPEGHELFKRLVKEVDVVIESFPPGYMASLNLSYEDLAKINPRIIITSITPFGQNGPYCDYKASDLTLWCQGGMAYVSGDEDRAPLQISSPQSYLHGAAAAATATMIALYCRDVTGMGQWVDVSIEEAVVHTLMNVIQFWDVSGNVLKRSGTFRTGLSATANQRFIWQCKDGHINFPVYGGKTGARSNARLAEWMESEGIGNEFLSSIDWEKFDVAEAAQGQFDHIEEPLSSFFMSHTMAELYRGAIERGIMLYPVYGVREIHDDPQLTARRFWCSVTQGTGEVINHVPGSPFFFSGVRPVLRPAPLIGEHNEEVYSNFLGLSMGTIDKLKQTGVI